MPNVQSFNLHPDKIYDVAGAALDVDGNPIALTSLDFAPDDSAVGVQELDADATDGNAALDTNGKQVDAVAELVFTADGSDGKKYEAVASITLVALDVPPSDFALVFTERVA